MYAANAHVIRLATKDDAAALERIAQYDSKQPPSGSALIGEIDGKAAAAISLTDYSVIADPFQRTAQLTQLLRMRATSLQAFVATPSLRDRMRNGVRLSGKWRPAAKAA